jgi:hypothetical protein
MGEIGKNVWEMVLTIQTRDSDSYTRTVIEVR